MDTSNRNKISVLNALSAIMLTLTNGLLGIIATKMIIHQYGSDFNGLNSTANQLINVLLIVEGGFTLASNVALFSPLTHQEYRKVNGLLYETQRKFRKIGVLFLSLGIMASLFFALFANSTLQFELIFGVIIMAVIPAAFNLYYATTYRVLLQAQQKEYIINIFTMITIAIGHIGNIGLIVINGTVWLVRAITMITTLLNSLLIVWHVKKHNRFLDLNAGNNGEVIHGTWDVMVQKVTGVIYLSAPIIFLAVSSEGGTVLASVYAVYNNVFNVIKSLLRSVIDAPRLGIGQMLTETDHKKIWNVFAEYEYIVLGFTFIICSTTYVLIMPFISMYTNGMSDVNYYDKKIALLMTLISIFEIIHIPSGHLINMSGKFKISKYIQINSLIILTLCIFILGGQWGIYGLLYAVLIVAILLAVLEIGYIHILFFSSKIIELVRMLLPFLLAGIGVCYYEEKIFTNIEGIKGFILYGIFLTVINTITAVIISMIFNKKITSEIYQRVLKLAIEYKIERSGKNNVDI